MSSVQSDYLKVGPLFTLLHRGSDTSPLLIVFSVNKIKTVSKTH